MFHLKEVIARFGASAKAMLANPGVTGEPEDQLRAPLEALFADLAELCGFKREWVTAVGEPSLSKAQDSIANSLSWHASRWSTICRTPHSDN